jgi:hypothetical protein
VAFSYVVLLIQSDNIFARCPEYICCIITDRAGSSALLKPKDESYQTCKVTFGIRTGLSTSTEGILGCLYVRENFSYETREIFGNWCFNGPDSANLKRQSKMIVLTIPPDCWRIIRPASAIRSYTIASLLNYVQ